MAQSFRFSAQRSPSERVAFAAVKGHGRVPGYLHWRREELGIVRGRYLPVSTRLVIKARYKACWRDVASLYALVARALGRNTRPMPGCIVAGLPSPSDSIAN